MHVGINALFISSQEFGGIGIYARNLVKHLTQDFPNNEYTLFVTRHGAAVFRDIPGITIISLPIPLVARPLRILAEQILLPFYIKRANVELLHSLGYTAPLIANYPSIVTIPDTNYRRIPESFSRLALFTLRVLQPLIAYSSDHIITISDFSKSNIVSDLGINSEKISVTHMAYDPNLFFYSKQSYKTRTRFTNRYGITKPFILSVASSYPHKNLEGLIKAFSKLVYEKQMELQLVLVGRMNTNSKRLLDLISEMNLQTKIIITGFVPSDDLPLFYSMAELFIFPSFYEGFGIPLLEAMACGTPIVSSTAGSLPEVAGDAAVLVDPYDIEDMTAGILRVLTDKKLANSLTQRGHIREKLFSWSKTAQETVAIYEKVFQENRSI